MWHIDASKVRLLDGTVAWLPGVLDNASRNVLAWTIAPSCEAAVTAEVLTDAVKFLPKDADPVMVITDDGRENVAVEDESFAGLLQRITAQVDVSFSNSMIESLWNQAKRRWLYLHELDTVDTLRSLFGRFIDDHNALIPRVALGGRTPDEVFLGCEQDVPGRLAELRAQARVERVAFNRALTGCGGCDGPVDPLPREEVVDCR
jgi:transposase InsO family protein